MDIDLGMSDCVFAIVFKLTDVMAPDKAKINKGTGRRRAASKVGVGYRLKDIQSALLERVNVTLSHQHNKTYKTNIVHIFAVNK